MKKLLSMILTLVLSLLFTLSAFAQTADTTTTEYFDNFISHRNSDASIESIVPMCDVDNETIAWLYILDPVGYIITDNNKEIIIEFSFSTTFEYDDDETIYFGGPTQYYAKSGNTYLDLKTGNILTKNEVESRSNQFMATTEELSLALANTSMETSSNDGIMTLASYSMDKDDFPLFCNNSDGRCGSVAAAILFVYYNNNGYSGLVSDSYQNNELLFTNYLYNHIEGLDSIAGSSTSDLVSGMNWYLQQKKFNSQLSAYSKSNGSYSYYTGKIDDGVPVILDLNEHPDYGEHWVVGYGYDYDRFIVRYNKFAIVNDGHGNNEIEINWDYVGDLVYLK